MRKTDMGDLSMRFSVQHARDGRFETDGLRQYFEYRDLGIRTATDGKAVMHVIRAREGTHATGEWHRHEVDLQLVYVLKGWVRFEYEGVGEVLLEAGSCVHQPPGIRHREIAHSPDLELIEIVSPADFRTEAAAAPAKPPA
ncbi:cupin domain-containing protein [Zeimonas arvi]|uniref:Cupin domain-containing protein n=2 Tax=Zeimonas arvi TaxID=2498847 RepID=A0A5C8P0W0_9BURK|nr:cupin domain-containing protein [Zeimonas arvi]